MATYLAAVVICFVLLRAIVFIFQKPRADGMNRVIGRAMWGRHLAALGSAILFTNALPHLVHASWVSNFLHVLDST